MSLTEYKPGSAFSGRMGRTVGESRSGVARTGALDTGRAERLVHRVGRHRLRAVRLLRLADQHPQPGPAGAERASLYEHAHHGAVLAVAVMHAHRAQPSFQWHGVHHRGVNRLPGFQRCDSVRERIPVRDAAPPRLCDVLRRQMAPDPGGTDQRGRPLRSLAAGSRVRPLLRLPRWRHPSVLSRPGLRQPPGRAADDAREGYHLTVDLADKAIEFIADLKQVAPDKPFFLYFATGANHAPHQVPKEWADKYTGKFDDGWDAYREKVFARQKELGIVATDAVLSRHDPDVQQWDELSDDERRLYARMMEVFAGFFEHTDHQIGRLLDFLEAIGQLDNTSGHGHLGQRGKCGGRPARLGQREQVLQQRARRPATEPGRTGRTRRTEVLQPLPVGLDLRGQHPVSPVEARDLSRRRLRPVPRALAQGHQGQGRDPRSVRARDRHGAHRAGIAWS